MALLAPLFFGLCGCSKPIELTSDQDPVKYAWNNYRLGEVKRAITTFEMILKSTDDTDENHLQALYGLATVWNLRRPDENPKLATEYYNTLIERAPDHELAAWSALAIARMKHLVPVGKDPDYDDVRATYRDIVSRYPGHVAADEAFLYLQTTYVMNMKPADAQLALDALETFIQEHPKSAFVSAAYSLISVCCETLGQPEKRLAVELKAFETAEIDPTNPFQDNAWRYWMLATLAEFDAGDFNTARKFYERLIEEYPTDIKVYSCEQALERMERIENQIRAKLKGDA